jgi:hypothetical protein
MYAAKLCGIVKLLRHIIYDRNKADVEISAPIKIYAPRLCVHQKIGAQTLVCLLFGLGRISNFWLLPSLDKELLFRWCCLSFMWSSSDLSTQAAKLIWAASLPYCTGCCTGRTCQNICALSKYLRAHIFSPFSWEKSKTYLSSQVSYHCT